MKRGHFWTKRPNLGIIQRKSNEIEEIPQFYRGKAIFDDRQTDGEISALRAGVPQISVHQNFANKRPSTNAFAHSRLSSGQVLIACVRSYVLL